MGHRRSFLRLTILLATCLVLLGCSDSTPLSRPASSQAATGPQRRPSDDHLTTARRALQSQNWQTAADAAYKALLQDPDNADATLVASQAEAARGNHQAAANLASSIDLQGRLGKRAAEIHFQQLLKLNRTSAAADVIIEALQVMPTEYQWRHQLWALLTRVGRREEASRQVVALCREGKATPAELLSLVRRGLAFPWTSNDDDDPVGDFESGLGLARWHFTQQDFSDALNELSSQYESEFESVAACALYGRLLAETQSFEEFPRWHARCDDRAESLGDYWAALGVYFHDQQQWKASARALMEAVYRDPTDRISYQRLSRVFHTLGEAEHAQQFAYRGLKIGETERLRDQLAQSPGDRSAIQSLAEDLVFLGRPFETLQWTQAMTSPSAASKLALIERQRSELRTSDRALTMASESSLVGVALNEYSLAAALETLRRPSPSDSRPRGDDFLARPKLVNVANQTGLNFQWYRDVQFDPSVIPIHESVGGGIAALDYDLDGWPDVYLAQGSGDPPTDKCTRTNVLVRNLSGRFSDATAAASAEDYNYSSGLAAGDVNQDGFPDLLLGSLGHNRLLINNGDGTFQEATGCLGASEDRFTSSLAIADINGDALPDLFETNYLEMEGGFVVPKIGPDGKPIMPGPRTHYSGPDRWFQRVADGNFRVHEIAREVAAPGTSLGIVVTDFDSDNRNDTFVGNDMRPNHLLVQDGENQFVNVADAKGVAVGFDGMSYGCMGIAAADFNRDGLIDLSVTNFTNQSANLYVQSAGGLFSDIAIRFGIDQHTRSMVGFGVKAIDLDRNGWLDLLITNGHIFDTRIYGEAHFEMPPQAMMSNGRRFELVDVDDESGYWQGKYLGRTMVTLDFDRDGSIDVLIGHMDKPVAVLSNQTQTDGKWIQIELIGTESERDAIGARVVITAGGESFTHWVTAGDGYLCTDEPVLDFGLGAGREVEKVEVFWPRSGKQTFDRLADGNRYLIIEGQPEASAR
jgi:Tfp pilus assembly protein PilF